MSQWDSAYCSISPSRRTLGFVDAIVAVGISFFKYLVGMSGCQGTG